MTSRTYATLNANALGDGLSLDQGNLVVTTNADGLDFHRAVFGTQPKGTGQMYFETYFYSTSRPTGGLVNLLSVGVAQVGSSLSKYVGEESTSYGFRPADGGIYNDDTESQSTDAIGERMCIGVLLDLTASTPNVVWYVDGSQIGYSEIDTDEFWVPAISIGATTAGDVSAFVNFGQRPFENQPAPVV